jgi:SAM-dependent methyltransferase
MIRNPNPSLADPREVVWPHLRALPAFRALIRAMETKLFLEVGSLPRPVLDIGCGDGHFAEVVWGQVDVGVDTDQDILREAQGRNVYDVLLRASATRLPFADASFATVVSNCVIEHIPDLDPVLSEVQRVLRPGGQFIFSVPTSRQNDYLFITRLLEAMGARGLAERYKSWFRRMQVHYHMYHPEEWKSRAEATGLRTVQQTGYMSPRATTLFDLGHFYGVPNLVTRKLTGQWVLWPWRPRFSLEESLLAWLVSERDPAGASCCFFVMEKEPG